MTQEVYYDSVPFEGKPTRVFGYVARPAGEGPFPAMLLVHGGKGKAFPQWAELWAKRGYVALAMDVGGNGRDGARLPDGGPDPEDETKFRAFTDETVRNMWTYHAVAAVLRGHALLAAQPDIDKNRIGITGISWGGYLTCIVAGIDDRLKVAVPIYGCGFIYENSAWVEEGYFAKMTGESRKRWIELFDPASYLPSVSCPMLFVNGTNDLAYPLDSFRKSYRLVKAPVTLRIVRDMPHGHSAGWAPAEIGAFVDSVLLNGKPLAKIHPPTVTGTTARCAVEGVSDAQGTLNYTADSGNWKERKWNTVDAKWDAGQRCFTAELVAARPLTFFFTVKDDRGLVTSSELVTQDE